MRWKATLASGWRIRGNPVALGADVVLASVADAALVEDAPEGLPTQFQRRNGVTGAVVWEATFTIPRRQVGTPDTPIAGAGDAALVLATAPPQVVDAASGRALHSIDGAGRAYGVFGGTLVADTRRTADADAPSLGAFDLGSGQPRWTYAFTSSVEPLRRASSFTRLSVVQDRVYGTVEILRPGVNETSITNEPARDSFLVALDLADGTLRWSTQYETTPELPLPWRNPPLVAADAVVVLRSPQEIGGVSAVVAYAVADGQERWVFPVRPRTLGLDVQVLASDGQRIFTVDNGPRWRTWLAGINRAWR